MTDTFPIEFHPAVQMIKAFVFKLKTSYDLIICASLLSFALGLACRGM